MKKLIAGVLLVLLLGLMVIPAQAKTEATVGITSGVSLKDYEKVTVYQPTTKITETEKMEGEALFGWHTGKETANLESLVGTIIETELLRKGYKIASKKEGEDAYVETVIYAATLYPKLLSFVKKKLVLEVVMRMVDNKTGKVVWQATGSTYTKSAAALQPVVTKLIKKMVPKRKK